MTLAVVTDSAADLPPEPAAAVGISVVSLTVAFGDHPYRDGIDLSTEVFWARIRDGGPLPTTASPSPGDFLAAYRTAAAAGATGVVSVHLSRALSRTVETADAAAREAPIPVAVVDSRSVSLGQGLVASAAARAAGEGTTLDRAADVARDAARRLRVVALLDGVEFLRGGGRVGAATAALSGLLRIRPVLALTDGEPVLVARSRTRSRGLAEVLSRVEGPAEAAGVIHSDPPDLDAAIDGVRERCGVDPWVVRMGAVTGSHLGPNAVGVVVLRPRPHDEVSTTDSAPSPDPLGTGR